MENDKYIGRLLGGRYELIDVVGVGGMAVVYRARDTILGRYVAIKILKEEFAKDPDIRKRFAIESRAVAKLSHHNIVSVYDVGNEDGTDYIVMELIEGVTLKEYLQQKGRLSWQESIFFAEQISSALVHAHSRGIIHQDIKPQNVIILRDGTAKLTDFGIASFATTQETRVVQEAIGSVHYISPEQAKGSKIDYVVSSGPEVKHQRYVASINQVYDLSSLIGPGAGSSSVTIQIRLHQGTADNPHYKILTQSTTIKGDVLLPVNFTSIESMDGTDQGTLEIVDVNSGAVIKTYQLTFFPMD